MYPNYQLWVVRPPNHARRVVPARYPSQDFGIIPLVLTGKGGQPPTSGKVGTQRPSSTPHHGGPETTNGLGVLAPEQLHKSRSGSPNQRVASPKALSKALHKIPQTTHRPSARSWALDPNCPVLGMVAGACPAHLDGLIRRLPGPLGPWLITDASE